MNLDDLLQGPMRNMVLEQLTSQMGLNNTAKTSTALDTSMDLLLNAVAKNVSQPDGAQSFINALNRDHDGSLVDHLPEYLNGQFQPQNASMVNGAGILKHLLGEKQDTAAKTIGKESGMDPAQIMKIMATLAPILMGVLGKTNQQNPSPSGGGFIDSVLNTTKKVNSQSPRGGIFTKILDKDGDGSIMDDVAGMGLKALFGKLFKKK